MATVDLSRDEFDVTKHYAGVRMQQGRVLTDDDWNESGRIDGEDIRRSRMDIIGPFGSPDDGFDISVLSGSQTYPSPGLPDFNIAAGTMYLGGLRLELETAQLYSKQTDWLDPTISTDQDDIPANNGQVSLVYLEAWQQPVSAVEDCELFEPALGGPDTTTRIRNMQRVRIANTSDTACGSAWNDFTQSLASKKIGTIVNNCELIPNATLSAAFSDATTGDDLCSPSVAGGYLGAENQAIRVELTFYDPSSNTVRFTWGFDNASPLYRVTTAPDTTAPNTDITLITQPKDTYHWPSSGQVIELLPCGAQLTNGEYLADEQSGVFCRAVSSFNPNTGNLTFTVGPATGGSAVNVPLPTGGDHIYMRVWNRGTDLLSNPEITLIVPAAGGTTTLGNTGISITLTGTNFNKGDYWIIAARPAKPQELIPWKLKTSGMPPNGVRRYFAPLALIQWTVSSTGFITGAQLLHDCRKTFVPLTELECDCCTFTVGDGINSHGDYSSIAEALANLPPDGGKICVLKGLHSVSVVISGLQNITISGCGVESVLQPQVIGSQNADGSTNPSSPFLFFIQDSENIKIEHLTMAALTTSAIFITSSNLTTASGSNTQQPSENIVIVDNQIAACNYGIYIGNVIYTPPPSSAAANSVGTVTLSADIETISNIIIRRNQISITNSSANGNDTSAIYSMADFVLIDENQITATPYVPPGAAGGGTGPGGGLNPCADASSIFSNRPQLSDVLKKIFLIDAFVGSETAPTYTSWGGIHVDSTSENVKIIKNVIVGGAMNGITLGGLAPDPVDNPGSSSLSFIAYTATLGPAGNILGDTYNIQIEDNYISSMGLSGIGPGAFYDTTATNGTAFLLMVNGIDIFRNKIQNCALQTPANPIATAAVGGVCLAGCEDAVIRENLIENNGTTFYDATCGVFIRKGAQIEIDDNRICNTMAIDKAANNVLKGTRGGIVILLVGQLLDPNNRLYDKAIGFFNPSPAVKICGNVVDQPIGHALLLLGSGLMSVVNNQLSSRGVDPNDPTSLLASTVYIINIGLSKDLLSILIMLDYQASNATQTVDPAIVLAFLANNATIATNLENYDLYPGGRVLFTDNQVTMDMRNNTNVAAVSAQLIFSLDDIGYDSNQSECIGFNILGSDYNVVIFHAFMLGVTLRCNNNRFTEGLTLSLYSLLSFALVNTTVGNQATHCLIAPGSYITTWANNAEIYNVGCAAKRKSLSGQ